MIVIIKLTQIHAASVRTRGGFFWSTGFNVVAYQFFAIQLIILCKGANSKSFFPVGTLVFGGPNDCLWQPEQLSLRPERLSLYGSGRLSVPTRPSKIN